MRLPWQAATPTDTIPGNTVIVCRAGRLRVAISVDSVEGLTERGATPKLELQSLLQALPGAHQPAAPPPLPPPPSETTAHLAIVLATQPCLLPLRSIRSVAAHVRPTALPDAPAKLIGVRAMGGQILPVVDARATLRLPDDEPASVDVEVVPPNGPAFVLAVQQLDGIVRLAAAEVHATDLHSTGSPLDKNLPGRDAVGGVVRLGGRLAWLLIPSALAPRSTVDE
jgi:chemotaxis signal transduction protein